MSTIRYTTPITIQIAAAGPAYDSGFGSAVMKLKTGIPAPAQNAGMNASAPNSGINPWSHQLNSARRYRQK